MYKKFIGMALWFVGSMAMAQQDNGGVFSSPVMPGPNGVFIYAADSSRASQKPRKEQLFNLFKEEKKGAGFKKMTVMGFPSSSAELDKRLGPALLQEILQKRKLRSAVDLYVQLTAGRFDTLGLYITVPAVLEALGILYIDKKVTGPDPGVSYRVESVYNGNTHVLYQIALSDIRYSKIPLFKNYRSMVTDSMAMVTWYSIGEHAAYATLFTNAGSGSERTFTAGARQYVYSRKDTLFVTCTVTTIPGSKVVLYIRPEDIPGNRGPASDTVRLLALSFANTLSISHLTAIDTMGSVRLHWDSLPSKAWCSGIEVLKSRFATSDYVVIDTLPVSATYYRDRKTMSGNVYYYQLRPILFDLPQRGKITPAIVNVITKKTRSKIMAPQGLRLSINPDNNIRLSWQPNFELDIFDYYILRGTSAANLRVISPPVRDTVFIDSLKGLNAGITYLYAVAAMNMDMLWSDTSAPVAMQSIRARLITAPGGIQARASATGIRLNWNDVSINDASVTGYMLYRRKKGGQYFMQLNKTPVKGIYYTDTTAMASGIYEYGCSSVDAWGHVSILSSLSQVDTRGGSGDGATLLYPPADFSLRNLSTGIEISLPPVVRTAGEKTPGSGASRYIVYRRPVTEKTFHKIGEIPESNTTYTDKQVMKDQLYAYTVTLQIEHAESSRSREKSIRRK